MKALAYEKIVVVTRRTRLAELVRRWNTRAQAKFYIERSGGDWADYEAEDAAYRTAMEQLERALGLGLKLQFIEREIVPTFLFGDKDIVVCVGQDGLVANVAKYALAQPIVAVNPDPARFDGVLLPFQVAGARGALVRVLEGKAAVREVTLAAVSLSDGQRLLAFNDLFVGARTHVSARYRLAFGEQVEAQSSSGVIVSTAVGSTGWLSSTFNMARGIARFAGGDAADLPRMQWNERELFFVVREPFASKHSAANLVCGTVNRERALSIESRMPSGGVIFGDGMEEDRLDFNAGVTATIGPAEERARLVIE